MKITANYSDNITKDVTSSVKLDYNFSKAGNQKVTVSYTENNITKSASFNVTVNALITITTSTTTSTATVITTGTRTIPNNPKVNIILPEYNQTVTSSCIWDSGIPVFD